MNELNSFIFKNMLIKGANAIADNFEYINELNIFPIPDGDTGTNMKITVTSAINDIANIDSNDLSILGKSFSRALLMNARGNSGVIFSQIMKGFVSPFKENQTTLSAEDLVECFRGAKNVAYGAVANPVEGTILSVIRHVYEYVSSLDISKYNNLKVLFREIVNEAKKAVNNTPNQLEELKKVGVVDSGGYGLYLFICGMNDALNVNDSKLINATKSLAAEEIKSKVLSSFDEHDYEEGFGYCSEIIMKIGAKINPVHKNKKEFHFDSFKASLEKMGDSLVCVQDTDLVKVHIHTFKPGEFLNYAQQFGEFIKVKFENMTEQYYERISRSGVKTVNDKVVSSKKKLLSNKIELVLTCPSQKIKKILAQDYGLKYVLNTEKIGNPSTHDMLLIVEKTKADKVFIITDDTNIVLAANQARDIAKGKIDIRVIKGSNVFQALIAALEFNPNSSMETNEKMMNNAVDNCLSGMISRSIKDVSFSNLEIKKDDYLAIIDKKIKVADPDEFIVLKSCLDLLMKEVDSADVLMVYYSSKQSLKILKELENYAIKKYDLVCEFKEGGQKIYPYLMWIQ